MRCTRAGRVCVRHDVQVENIERLLVHVEDAYRMAVVRDPAHLRLSLLLFDSAAELILHRATGDGLRWQEYPRRSLGARVASRRIRAPFQTNSQR